jgi:hypothetical protein
MMLRHWGAIALTIGLAGCSGGVTLVKPEQVADFQPGKTNQTEVVAALGKPLHTVSEADGTKIDQYAFATGATSGSDSIWPDFLGGGDSTGGGYRMIDFYYGSGGVLKQIGGAK